MAKNKFRRLVCGDPRAACFNLESVILDLWCSLLVETLAAERNGIRRCKTAISRGVVPRILSARISQTENGLT